MFTTGYRAFLVCLVGCALAVISATGSAWAVPVVSVQGVLRSASGLPVPDAKYGIMVRLYDAADAPKPIWQELEFSVVVDGGVFTLNLGAADPEKPLPSGLFITHPALWLGLQVIPSEAELPRLPLPHAAYAWHTPDAALADLAKQALGLTCAGCIKGAHVDFVYAGADSKGGAAVDLQCTGCVLPERLADGAVGVAQIAKAAVEEEHLASQAVGATALDVAWAVAAVGGGKALMTLDLQCTGCVQADELAPGTVAGLLPVASAAVLGGIVVGDHLQAAADGTLAVTEDFVLAENGLVSGDLQVNGKLASVGLDLQNGAGLEAFLIHGEAGAPACNGAATGALSFDTDKQKYVGCTGSAWVELGYIPVDGQSQGSPGLTCKSLLDGGFSKGNGTYWIDPNGGATNDAFQVECNMTTDGGGWTRLIPATADALPGAATKEYLYLSGSRWYRSPKTTLVWSWSGMGWGQGKQLTGSYGYFNGSTQSTYTCSGSGEQPMFGVGCSSGGGGTPKTLPAYTKDAGNATCTICQDVPNAYQSGACQGSVAIYARW